MTSAELRWPVGGTSRLELTDLNRLRWTVAALRLNGPLAKRLATARASLLVDSNRLLQSPADAPPEGTAVVLWDGLNSLLELQQALPAYRQRHDLRYLYVGAFDDLLPGFPANSEPLFPNTAPRAEALCLSALELPHAPRVPLRLRAASAWRAAARPWKNAMRSPALHHRLQAGGNLVFCGLVRPTADVLDGFVRGTTMPDLRAGLQPLAGLDWTAGLASVQAVLTQTFAQLQRALPASPADHAALYAVTALLHRLGTLTALRSQTDALAVNEYGVHPHFDPYDADAYRNNLFIDFGSTRGHDLVYPRSVDLLLQRKTFHCLRFLGEGHRLTAFLASTDAAAFRTLCQVHAGQLLQRLPGALQRKV